MRKKLLSFCMCLGIGALCGCGVKTTPEIIMPEKPMESSAALDQTKDTGIPLRTMQTLHRIKRRPKITRFI